MSFPRRHRSALEVLGPLTGAPLDAPEAEPPLFAASRAFAQEVGGPITRAFLQALPEAWGGAVVVDSSLVWLTPGLAHDDEVRALRGSMAHRAPPLFRHEPFPGHTQGLRAEVNANVQALHQICVVGLDCTPVAALGDIDLPDDEAPESFWLTDDLAARDRRLRAWLEQGQLQAAPLPVNTLVRFGWGTFLCPRPASRSGFQLVLRATYGDPRPRVDGLRNVSFM